MWRHSGHSAEGVSLFAVGWRPGGKCTHQVSTFVWAFPKVSPLLRKQCWKYFYSQIPPNLPILINEINNELHNIATWYIANKMTVKKTRHIIFHNKRRPLNTNGLELYFNNIDPWLNIPLDIHSLEYVNSFNPNTSSRSNKLLGIHMDGNLYNYHYNALFFLCLKKKAPTTCSAHTILIFLSLPSPLLSYHPQCNLGCAGFANKFFRFKAKRSETRSVSHAFRTFTWKKFFFASFRFEFFASDQSEFNRAYFRFVLIPKIFRFASNLSVSLWSETK
jgi:hypothetical protein